MNYPKVKFHPRRCQGGVIVHSAEQMADLGEGWVDSPSEFPMDPTQEQLATIRVSAPFYEIEGLTIAEIIAIEVAKLPKNEGAGS